MTKYPQYPKVIGTSDNKFVLVGPYQVKNIRIPSGYESDGLSLRFRPFRLIISRYSPKFMPFFFIHDYLCSIERFSLANEIGEEVLFKIERSFRTRAMMFLIKKYHRIKHGV
jgi:hypothetical protein